MYTFCLVIDGKRNGIDYMKVTYIFGSHTNTCDLSNVDQLELVRTRVSFYKKCIDHVLSGTMVRMGDLYSVDAQSMVEILRKTLPERKDMDRHIVYKSGYIQVPPKDHW